MSWWVSLNDSGNPLEVASFMDGGTYAVHGSQEADLNITWNYSPYFYNTLDAEKGIRWMDGKTGRETLIALATAVSVLGTKQNDDYWRATKGNAGHALSILLMWAAMYPSGVWEVS